MLSRMRLCSAGLAATVLAFVTWGASAWARRDRTVVQLEESRIYIEYNSTANALVFPVSLAGEDWTSLKITNPARRKIFQVEGRGPYKLGLTELFFEGAEPSLDEFPLEDLLALFPEGPYKFSG